MASKNSKTVSELNAMIDASMDKYSYFLARYMNDLSVDLRSPMEYNYFTNYAFDLKQDDDLLRSAYMNVIKSAIDTVVSKMATKKVHPFFNPINGMYKTRSIVKNVQTYFDTIYSKYNIRELMVEAFKDACIFGTGNIWINPILYKIEVLKPHMVAFYKSELKYGEPKRMLVKYLNYPSVYLKSYGIQKNQKDSTVTLWHYIDADSHTQELFVNGNSVKTLPYKPDVLPVVSVYYTKPVFGDTVSLVQELDGIQTQIDNLNAKISACAQAWSGNTTYVLENSNLTASDIDNHVGKVFTVRMPNSGGTPPVVNVAPPILDPQALNLLDFYIAKAYEVTGISQLSAMSKKPSGADSGIALQTLEDVESDRLQVAEDHYIQSYTDLAKLIIEVLPEDEDILPDTINTSSFKWKDVKKQSDLFKIQYSVVASKSNDPAEMAKEIMTMTNIGLIDQGDIAPYLDRPDLQHAFSAASAKWDGVQQCIQRAVEYEDYEIPEFVSYQDLAQAITKEENILYAQLSDDKKGNEEVEESLSRLMVLEEVLLDTMEKSGFVSLEGEEAGELSTGEVSNGEGTTDIPDATDAINNTEAEQLQDNRLADEEAQKTDALANPEV